MYPGINMATVSAIENYFHAEIEVACWAHFKLVFVLFESLDKVVCIGLCLVSHPEIVDDETEYDISGAVPKEARSVRTLDIAIGAEVCYKAGLAEFSGLR